MDQFLGDLFGIITGTGSGMVYSVVDNENVLYHPFWRKLYGFALADPGTPPQELRYATFLRYNYRYRGFWFSCHNALFGLFHAYDGHLDSHFSNGVAVIDRDLDLSAVDIHRFGDYE